MCLGGDKAQAPDPYATAQAQSGVNRDSLITAAQLNQIKQTGPFGTVEYSGSLTDPNDPRVQTTSLTPELQRLLTGQQNVGNSLTDLANNRLAGAPQGNFELGTNPTEYMTAPTGTTPGRLQTDIASAGDITKSFDPGGTVQRSVDLSGAPQLNTDFGALSQQAQDANYAQQSQYLDPQFSQGENDIRSRLSAQGITQGSDAYNREMENFGRQKQAAYSDARNSAIGAGNARQSDLFGQNLAARQQTVGEKFDLGGFFNSALGQQFGMNQNQAQFQNQAQAQQYDQNANDAEFRNAALAAQFGMDNQANTQNFNNELATGNFNQNLYQQGLQNQITGRNQNINEAMSYVNGSPINPSTPQYQPIAQSTAAQASPDMIGLAGSNYRAAQQARSSGLGSIFGSLGQLGASAITACWVAREVYGNEVEWARFWSWKETKAPKTFRAIYNKFGERIAAFIKGKPRLKAMIRSWMDSKIHAAA